MYNTKKFNGRTLVTIDGSAVTHKHDNVFVYAKGDGKDVIFGFEDDDMLKITGTFSASYNRSKGEVAFKVGSTKNAITLKNFDTSSFNVNGDIYRISGSKLVKR